MEGVEGLVQQLKQYAPDADVALVQRAYEFAARAHDGQTRKSGEPYVTHSVAVAQILADLQLDATPLAAALLHDVPEDTTLTLDDLQTEFGAEVARLVDGVTKLERLRELSHSRQGKWAETQAENLRKIFLATVDDIRVIMIKLADRLHNMRTLSSMPPEKQKRIAQETLDVYAPLANRLGIWELKWQLEDLALQYLEPQVYQEIADLLAEKRREREEYIDRVIGVLCQRLDEEGLEAEVTGRPKHLYSIYRKMREKNRYFEEIYDVRGVRILVEEIKDCYAALGIIHSMWRPIPGQFDDYIASPKDNLYQSLHTAVIGPEGRPLEIQIRTWEMHRVADYGIAAHWRYKEHMRRDVDLEAKIAWLRQVSDWRQEVRDASQFVESLKSDVLPERVYVFTPKGDIVDLPQGATPVDFAYYIHTEIGHRCRGAKVNGRLVPLDYQLHTGEQIDILTAKKGAPSRDWLNPQLGYINTARARQKVRQWFRQQERGENVAQGRDILEKELRRLGLEERPYEQIAKLFKYQNVETFLAAVGYGDISPQQIATKLAEISPEPLFFPEAVLPPPSVIGIQVRGVGDLLTRLGRCCNPVPGDPIIGYITRGTGITVHRRDCPNVQSLDTERFVDVEWGITRQAYPVKIRIEAFDRAGLLRDIATIVADEGISMSAVNVSTHDDNTATIQATLEIGGIEQLRNVLSKLEESRDVLDVRREKG
ncbi:MAG: bifunctional (p)ppGpp synthetase/guanosine-3',5'-bis(diphosphate) 3'-pyrophosphohydrolase [Anaerolineales bacterium]|nr:MAG: bifunctional (p)ppGpp synthetase/guanosine-3',5'-bis(diphosphate) 3'-pyrophosphohydrolase [Anaerolineales bacterium]